MDLLETQKKQQFGEILTAICETLEISETQYYDAEEKYNAVGKWLNTPGSTLYQYSPRIYPQGSIRIGTTVKPLGGDEFDLDLVCELSISSQYHPDTIKEMVGQRLRENEIYRKMLEPMNRCWRLNYAGAFHMDILPAIPDQHLSGTNIFVPDKKLQAWKESNPIGYAEWFEDQMKTIKIRLFEELKASLEGLPKNDRFVKTPLQRVVQILKRHRDISFTKDKDKAPISIIITTLAAKAYQNEYNLYTALFGIIDGMPKKIDWEFGLPKVKNPVNAAENFAETWEKDPQLFDVFTGWLKDLNASLLRVPLTEGISAINDALTPIFGENITKASIKRYADKVNAKREHGGLSAARGTAMLGATGLRIPKNTFYGK